LPLFFHVLLCRPPISVIAITLQAVCSLVPTALAQATNTCRYYAAVSIAGDDARAAAPLCRQQAE
jgi:hypothetical protein